MRTAQARKAKYKFVFKDNEPDEVLDELALELWFSGFHVIPTLGNEFDPKKVLVASKKSAAHEDLREAARLR